MPLAPGIVIFEAVWTVRLVRRLRREQLADAEVLPPPGMDATLPLPADEPPPPPTVVPPAAPVESPGKALGWILTIFGGLTASGGDMK